MTWKLIRAEQVNQVMICLPWAAEQRIHGLVNRLRQLSVNVMLVPTWPPCATATAKSPTSAAS